MSAPFVELGVLRIDLFEIGFTPTGFRSRHRGVTVSQRALESPRQASERRKEGAFLPCQSCVTVWLGYELTPGPAPVQRTLLRSYTTSLCRVNPYALSRSSNPGRQLRVHHDHHRARSAHIVLDDLCFLRLKTAGAVMIMWTRS